MPTNKNTSGTKSQTSGKVVTGSSHSGNATGKISHDILQHSLKPNAPSTIPTRKPGPGPKK